MANLCSKHLQHDAACAACNPTGESIPVLAESATLAQAAGMTRCLGCRHLQYRTSVICPKCGKPQSAHYVLPVIHFFDAQTALEQADVAMAAGADGVFLISHHGSDDDLIMPAMTIKGRYPHKAIGINFLSKTARDSLECVMEIGLDMVWTDDPGVSSRHTDHDARMIASILSSPGPKPLFFGSVAFKYKDEDASPALAGRAAASLGMLPTTSGAATGAAPDVEKIRSMREELVDFGAPDLAIASGLSPENIRSFMPYATHFLVATKVSKDAYRFDPARLAAFVAAVRAGSTQPSSQA